MELRQSRNKGFVFIDSSSVEGQAKSNGSSSTKPVRFDPIGIKLIQFHLFS